MYKLLGVLFMLTFFLNGCQKDAGKASSEESGLTRDKVETKYKWNLEDLYKTKADWDAEKDKFEKSLNEFKVYQGKLSSSAAKLNACLDLLMDKSKTLMRLYSYASMLSDQNTKESGPLAMKQEMGQIATKFSSATAFIEPEILKISENRMKSFYRSKPSLKVYAQYLDDIQRRRAHTLDPSGEKIIADAGIMAGSPDDIYSIFSNADLPYPTVKLSSGEDVYLNASGYALNRASSNREDRKKVFETFFGTLKKFERTFGTQLYAEVKKDMFYKNVRKYDSCVQSALDANNIPVEVYTALIDNAHKNLPTLYRYLKLRKRMLGLDELHYYDMYPSLVKKVEMDYDVKGAEELIKKALAVLGDNYVGTLDKAFNNRWIDMYPTLGKRSGAYSNGSAYDVHPYILMNFNGKYDDVSTLAHELGHTMHSYYSNTNQPYVNSDYPIFLAEVASTTNEVLLANYVLSNLKDKEKKLSILGSQLESFRTTLFRQTMFAEFELKMHQMAESGESLTGDNLTKLYLSLLKKYYGVDEGITKIEDLYGIEWAYIPHFYYNFYVFQYATSYCASTALAEKILEDKTLKDKFIKNFLSAGRSEYAVPILKGVGVDMTTSEPFDLAMKKMNSIMDEMEKLLNAK